MTDTWIGVDLDGTLARYETWAGASCVGAPIPKMVARVKDWLAKGQAVRILTARVHNNDIQGCRPAIEKWCLEHLGQVIPVTSEKDFQLLELWDDKAVRVEFNTGEVIS